MNEWQPIDSAPRDGTRVLLASGIGLNDGIFVGHYEHSVDVGPYGPFVWVGHPEGTVADRCVTHWMPLPEPPK